MAADRSLDLICIKENFPAVIPKRPSWMLDLLEIWSRPKPFLSHAILSERRNYSSKPHMERLESGVLKVRGKLLDRINSISTAATMRPVPEEIRDPFAVPSSRLYGSDTGVADAVWKSPHPGRFPQEPG